MPGVTRPRRKAAVAAEQNVLAPIRKRKQIRAASGTKRRRVESPTDDAQEDDASEDEADGSGGEQDETPSSASSDVDSGSEVDLDDTGDFEAPGSKPKRASTMRQPRKSVGPAGRASSGTSGRRSKASGPATTKRQQASRPKAGVQGQAKRSGPRGAWKGGKSAGVARTRAPGSKEELAIHDDNSLFNALRMEDTSLQEAAETCVVNYRSQPGEALAELVTFFLRCSACNSVIDVDAAQDTDAIVSTLDEIQEVFKASPLPSYPVISRAPAYRKFSKCLADFMQHLITSAAEADILFDGTFFETILAWISPMSSSSFRSFRHTATDIALWVVRALANLSGDAKKESIAALRARDNEKKRARVDKTRLRELEAQVKQCARRSKAINGFVDEIMSSVFVHRYRDSDPSIRTDCVDELGGWMRAFPDTFQQSSYFRYIGWTLSDGDAAVRLASIRALSGLFPRNGEPAHSLRHFTDMFKARLVEMAVGDVDVGVRIASIQVLGQVDRHGLLSGAQRDRLALHIFDVEPRVRNAVAGFVASMIDEALEEQLADLSDPSEGSSASPVDEARDLLQAQLRLKCTASLMSRLLSQLDQAVAADTNVAAGLSEPEVVAVESRISLAAGALWEASNAFNDWKSLAELLLLDHSGEQIGKPGMPPTEARNSRRTGKRTAAQSLQPGATSGKAESELLCLSAEEESLLVEALGAVMAKIKQRAALALITTAPSKGAKETSAQGGTSAGPTDPSGDEAIETAGKMTRDLIPALPKLFAKYRTDAPRITELLGLMRWLDLGVYVETQQLTAYELLWDEISGQFLRHVEPALLANAMRSISHLLANDAVAHLNASKLGALQDELVASLREAVQGRDVETATFDEDQLHLLSACLSRLKHLVRACNMTEALDEDVKGTQTSGWDIVLAVASRGRLGFAEESQIVESAISVLSLSVMWATRGILGAGGDLDRDRAAQMLLAKRTTLLTLLHEIVSGIHKEAQISVRQEAFRQMLDIYIMYGSIDAREAVAKRAATSADQASKTGSAQERLPGSLHLMPSDEVQHGVVDFAQAELERFADELASQRRSTSSTLDEEDQSSAASDAEDLDGDDDVAPKKVSTKAKGAKVKASTQHSGAANGALSASRPTAGALQLEHQFCHTLSRLIRAVRLGTFEVERATPLLAYYGRLGPMYDACTKQLMEALRDQGVYGGKSGRVCEVALEAMKLSFDAYMDEGSEELEAAFNALSRNLGNAIIARGPHLTILRAVRSESLVRMHGDANSFAAKRVGQASRNNDKTSKARALAFWKGLSLCLASADGKDAVRIKTGLNKALAEAEVETLPSAKMFDPLRSYEKRLVTIASKNLSQFKRAAAAPAEPAEGEPTGTGQTRDAHEVEEALGEGQEERSSRPRPRPTALASTPVKRRAPGESAIEGESGEEGEGENSTTGRDSNAENVPPTPLDRSPGPSDITVGSFAGIDVTEDDADATMASQALPAVSTSATPEARRKRPRAA